MTPKQKDIMDDVFSAVARVTSVTYEQFSSRERWKEFMVARQLFSHICVRDHCAGGYSNNGRLNLTVIGEYQDRDHASVINHCKRAKDYLLTEPKFRRLLREVDDYLIRSYGVATDKLKWTKQYA